MSSGTHEDVGEVGHAIRGGAYSNGENGTFGDGITTRQRSLSLYWRTYRCETYDSRKYDWNGTQNIGKIEHDFIATSGSIPPGFYDAGRDVPLKFRKPVAPYYLGKVVVDRFTSMLFSHRRHPRVLCEDPATEDWLSGFAESAGLWSQMIQARTYGGAMGSAAISYAFCDGEPRIEVHDPRWCTPSFVDSAARQVRVFEKLYQYLDNVHLSDGTTEERVYWYRRVIDAEYDTTWDRVPVIDGSPPDWDSARHTRIAHGLGETPVVWIQNTTTDGSFDGDPDCYGILDMIEEIDALYSQGSRGTKANCDPTLILQSDAAWDAIAKGSGNALQVEKGGTANYLEMTGAGVRTAMDLAEKLEEKSLTVARCVLDRNTGGPSRTASEVDHTYSAMLDQADIYREQYGRRGVQLLLQSVLRAARRLMTARIEKSEDGIPSIVRTLIKLPKKRVEDENTGVVTWHERQLGQGEQIALEWPPYYTPSESDAADRVKVAGTALQYGLIDQKHAIRYVASLFGVKNQVSLLASLQKDSQRSAIHTTDGYLTEK